MNKCSIEDCGKRVAYRIYRMCDKHGRRMKRHGSPFTVKRLNKYPVTGNCLICDIECLDSFCGGRCKDRASRLKKDYGLDADRYRQMLLDQLKLCKICRQWMNRPCVDHNHKTGRVRGLLCVNCNLLIGQCQEDSWILRRAANYLDEENDGIFSLSPELLGKIETLTDF